jgi:2-keto-3-deoxy-L-rhamnonate aldolase RhmA
MWRTCPHAKAVPGVRVAYTDEREIQHALDAGALVIVVPMIETLEGLANAEEIAKVPGVSAVFAASGDLGNFSGYRQGTPDYERVINIVHDAAIKAGVRLCGPLAWRDRPDFTCFQAGSETAAIARGVAAELGPLANTQGKPEAGPFAVTTRQ